MIRILIAAAALLASTPVAAQSQDKLDARYDRALAAGYKALFLCSAIANAERNGATRTPENVTNWELTGIQAPLDGIAAELDSAIERDATSGAVIGVSVPFAELSSPRYAAHRDGKGCSLLPMSVSARAIADFTVPTEGDSTPDGGAPEAIVTTSNPTLHATVGRALANDPAYGERARTTAVVVHRDGARLHEAYVSDFGPTVPQRTWSVAKSIAATLIGAAVKRGEADVAGSAGLGAADTDPRRAITIDHLLRMASGRYSDTPGNSTDPLYFGGSTVDETAAHWPLIHKPGTVFRYANNDTLMAIEAISPTFEAQPPAGFFAKLGMRDTVAETDWQGDFILSSQVWSTARDLARLGQLYLDDGVWNGERILPEGWREYVSSPSGPQPEGPFGYGAGFWLLHNSESVPPDTFAAMGNRGQFIVIVPSREVVIVRRGEDPAGSRFDIAAFTRDVLAALGD